MRLEAIEYLTLKGLAIDQYKGTAAREEPQTQQDTASKFLFKGKIMIRKATTHAYH